MRSKLAIVLCSRFQFAACFLIVLLSLAGISTGHSQGSLSNGQSYSGTITTNDMQDDWTLTANAGDYIIVVMSELTDAAGYFTPQLELIHPNSAVLQSSWGSKAADIGYRTTNSGTFTVRARSHDARGEGNYNLSFARAPGAFSVPDDGGPIINGARHTGSIILGDLDVWSFTANIGDRVLFQVGQLSGTAAFEPWLRLFGPDGAIITSEGQVAVQSVFQATTNGTFTVVIGDGSTPGDGEGTYLLNLAKSPGDFEVSDQDEGGPLTNGANHDGTIEKGDLDMWSFAANAGEGFSLRAARVGGDAAFGPRMRVYDPNGVKVGDSAGEVTGVTLQAATNGDYTVVIGAGGSLPQYTGDYRLCFAQFPGEYVIADDGGNIYSGQTQEGIIEMGDLDIWSFYAPAGGLLTVQITELTDTNAFRPSITLYGPDGKPLSSAQGASQATISLTPTNSGLYRVVASDGGSDFNGIGRYEILTTFDCGLKGKLLFDDGESELFSDRLRVVHRSADGAIGYVAQFSGGVTISDSNDVPRNLFIGAPIYLNDLIETDENGEIVIAFCDGTSFPLSSNVYTVVDEYLYDPDSGTPKYNLLRWVFTWTAGFIGREEEDVRTVPQGSTDLRGDASQYMDPSVLDIAVTMNAASPVTLYTAVDVTNSPFDFSFDYAFLHSSGTLNVALGGITLLSRAVGPTNTPTLRRHASITVTNPMVLNLGLTELTFTYDGPAGSDLFLDNIQMPGLQNGDFTDFDGNWFSRGHGEVLLVASLIPPCSVFTALYVETDGDQATLRWPLMATNYVLETTTTVDLPLSWVAATNAVNTATNSHFSTIPLDAEARFYRLKLDCN